MLTEENYTTAAAFIGCEPAAIKAVTQKESDGISFWKSGKLVLKYEGHLFHHFTNGTWDKNYPTLSYPAWTEKYTQYGDLGYDRFDRAFALDPHAAMMATSWGMFQILGENYSSCGFKTVNEMVDELHKGDEENLLAFCHYVKTQGLDKYMRGFKTDLTANSEAFALRYNGKLYARNNYAVDIAKFYSLYSKLPSSPL